MARTHTFKGSASAGYGYFAYIEDGQLVIGEEWGREGGILYKGPYAHVDKHTMRMLENAAPKLYKSIVQYYAELAEREAGALAKAAAVGITHRFKDSRDSRGNGYSGYIKNGKLFLEYTGTLHNGEYFRGSYTDAKVHLDYLKIADPVLYADIEKYFTKHGVKDESDRKYSGNQPKAYTVKLMMNNGKELDAIISGTSASDVISKLMPPTPNAVVLYDLEGRVMAVRSDKIYTVAILD